MGNKPTIGAQDFARLGRAIRDLSHEAQRLQAVGYVEFARELRNAAHIAAQVDGSLAVAEDAKSTSDRNPPAESSRGDGAGYGTASTKAGSGRPSLLPPPPRAEGGE